MLKLANLVYVGYVSGLGSLRDPVFDGSCFAVGDSCDEIVDRRTGRTYTAGTRLDESDRKPGQDFASISCSPG